VLNTLFIGILGGSIVTAKSLTEYIQEAQSYFDAKDIEQAITTRQRYVDFFTILPRAFAMWDTAIGLASENLDARYSRGSWGVYLPQSLGQLEKAIGDLEFVTAAVEGTDDIDLKEQYINAYFYLAQGYRKNWQFVKAKETYKKIIEIDPDADGAQLAQSLINDIIRFENWLRDEEKRKATDSPEVAELREYVAAHPEDIEKMLTLGNTYLEANKDQEAVEIFERAVTADSSNIKAYKMLAFALKKAYAQGYDPRISMDHNYLTDGVFRVLKVLDRAVSIAPDDMELKLMRAQVGLQMFFFPGRREQAIEDLQIIIESDTPEIIKSAARYELGRAFQKQANTNWLKSINEYPNMPYTDSIFNELHASVPGVDLSQYKTPAAVVSFVMAFRDELPPQTVVWVETKEGTFVKTIYVSGFTGYARAKGRLPQWQASSDFFDVDAVTGASIDMGHHVFVWDLKNAIGERVSEGDYLMKVEVTFWPSMQYQHVVAPVKIGYKEESIVVKEGNLIPYLEVHYLP